MKKNIYKVIIVITICFLSLNSCKSNNTETTNTTTNNEIIDKKNIDPYYFSTKNELFEHYFAEFYDYIINVRNGKTDLESYGIVDINSFYVFLKTYEGGNSGFPTVGKLLGKYYLRKDIGGSIYNQKAEDGFVGYCLENDVYKNATLFFEVFFSYFRKEEGVDLKYEHATDFLALPNDSIIDVIKYFYYDRGNLPRYFTPSTVTYKLINQVPDSDLVEFITSKETIPLNKTNIQLNEDDYFGKKANTTAIYKVQVDDDDIKRYKKIAITFDSGVTIEKTLPLLEVLDKYNIKSTFFMTYDAMKESPELVLEIINRGHEVANHSTTHSDFRKICDLSKKLELYFTHKYIKDLTGIDMYLFRYPYGSYDNDSMQIVRELGYYPIQWSNDSIDWKNDGVESILANVYAGGKIQSGSIILFHNGAEFTIEALPYVIDKIKQEGFEFAKVSDLIYTKDFHINTATGLQIKKDNKEDSKE